jgi:hypothetical protein
MINNNATSLLHSHSNHKKSAITTYSQILLKFLVYCVAVMPFILIFHSSSDEHETFDHPSEL